MNYKRDLGRIQQLTENAKLAAWGPKMIPLDERKKVCICLEDNKMTIYSIVYTHRSRYPLEGLPVLMAKGTKMTKLQWLLMVTGMFSS